MEARWTSQETAKFLSLSEQTLANWRWSGKGPPFLKLGGACRYDPEAVRLWAAGRERTSTSDPGQR